MRCKCCNEKLEDNDIVWDEARKTFEEMCSRCIRASRSFDDEDNDYDEELRDYFEYLKKNDGEKKQ